MKRPRGARSGPTVEILVESELWKGRRGVRPLLRQAIAAAAATLSTRPGELAIVLTDDSAIRKLNRAWRGKDEPTNVLAFPAAPQACSHRLIGDIVIAYETLAREAAAERRSFTHHLAHLAVHGFLHLCGHDHDTDEEAAVMERLEVAVLARLRIANPYQARNRGG